MQTLPKIDVKATGLNIQKLMKDNNISKRELQNTLGFSTPQAIYKWVRGVNMPTLDNLVIIADVLNVTLDDIVVTEK